MNSYELLRWTESHRAENRNQINDRPVIDTDLKGRDDLMFFRKVNKQIFFALARARWTVFNDPSREAIKDGSNKAKSRKKIVQLFKRAKSLMFQ